MGYSKELLKATTIKILAKALPSKGKYRILKLIYNYQSSDVKGVDICIPYFPEYKMKFLVNTKDVIGWKIFFFGYYEKSTNDLLKKFVKKGDVVIEAGANNGSETLLLSKLVQHGRVYAFEPIPHVYNRLNFNVQLNEMNDNIILSQLAIGEENKTVTFNVFPKDFENQGMSSKYSENSRTTKLDVKQVKLDTFVQEMGITKIDFLKMDIQGAEIDLIKGGYESISKFKPIIFTEAAEEYLNIESLYSLLFELKYNIFLIEENGFKELKSATAGNWIAIHSKSKITI